jgi:IS30 family transposase
MYYHFKPEQRNELAALLRAGLKQKDIAKLLGKTASAVCQELKRNGTDNKSGYDVGLAKKMTKERRIIANQRFKKIENNLWLRNYIEKKIKKCKINCTCSDFRKNYSRTRKARSKNRKL